MRALEKGFSDMIRSMATGSVILILGQMGSTLISAVGSIIVARILGSTDYGVVSIAMIPVNISLLFLYNGVGSALIKFLVEERHREDTGNLRSIIVAGFSINLAMGLVISVILFLLADFLAFQVFQLAELGPLIKILSASVLAQFLLETSYMVFVGYERMEVRSIVSILFSVLKSVMGPVLVFMGYGVVGAAYGYTIPFLATAFVAVLLVLLFFRGPPSRSTVSQYLSLIVAYSYPLFFSNLLSGSLSQVLNFILPFYVSASAMGNYSAAAHFSVLVTLFTAPFATVTFTLLSKLEKGDEALGLVFQNIVKYESMIVFPVAAALFALSDTMVGILYGATYPSAPLFIKLIMFSFFFIGIGDMVVGGLLNSQKDTRVILQMTLIYIVLGAPIGFLLIPRLGVVGFQVAQLLAPKFGLLYGLWWIYRNYRIKVDLGSTFRIAVSTVIGYLSCMAVKTVITGNPWVELFVSGVVLAISYSVVILLIGALTKRNIADIQGLVIKYDWVKRPLGPILALMERIARE